MSEILVFAKGQAHASQLHWVDPVRMNSPKVLQALLLNEGPAGGSCLQSCCC